MTDSASINSYCSWCFQKTKHTRVMQNYLTRNVYQCTNCRNNTLQCRYCTEMARGEPSPETLALLNACSSNETDQNSSAKFFKAIKTNLNTAVNTWNNELCAEHDGTIASFKNLSMQIDDISNYASIFVREKPNLAKVAKHSTYMGAGVITAGMMFATGGTAGAFAAAAGKMGLLGTAGSGAAISALNGAALTSASLAAIGGSVATGTLVVSASGLALGGVVGGVVANHFHGDDDSFSIRKLKESKADTSRTVFINGFTQKNETDFHDWQCEHLYAGLRHTTYGVTWDAKSNATLGAAFAGGVGKQAGQAALMAIAKQGGKQAAKKLGPLGIAALISDLVTNPWHSAMLRASQAGVQLAESISRTNGQKFNLVGHSLGCRVIYYALEALGTKTEKYINNVILLGGAVGKDDSDGWRRALNAIDGTLYNCHSNQDMVLYKLYQIANANLSQPIGYYPITLEHPRIRNINCDDVVDSHMTWKKNYSTILSMINSETESAVGDALFAAS